MSERIEEVGKRLEKIEHDDFVKEVVDAYNRLKTTFPKASHTAIANAVLFIHENDINVGQLLTIYERLTAD